MVTYSIKDLETISGIKAHTIRIWEKRYDLIQPKRTDTNIRYYTEVDLRRLLNVCCLYKKGYKISKIVRMCPITLRDKVSCYSHMDLDYSEQLDALMLLIVQFDRNNFNKIVDKHLAQKGLEATMDTLIYPLLDKLHMAWLGGSVLNVHQSFVSQILSAKIIMSTETLPSPDMTCKQVMIYLPPGQMQGMTLLYMHFLLKKGGCSVIDLGMGIGLEDVLAAREQSRADYIVTMMDQDTEGLTTRDYIHRLASGLTDCKLLITGAKARSLGSDIPEAVVIFSELDELKAVVCPDLSID